MPSSPRTASALIAELKRRQVIRVGSICVVVAWLIAQVADGIPVPTPALTDGARFVALIQQAGLNGPARVEVAS